MKVIKGDDAQEFRNSETCSAFEYPLGDKDINGAVIKLNGRYPESDYVTNKVCKEIVYVIEGNGTLATPEKSYELSKGDVALLMPGETYYFEGSLTMFMPCVPAWYPDQHEHIMLSD